MFDALFQRSGLDRDLRWSKWVFQWLALSLILHLIATVRSSGFYHADEHFQIIEFMNYKLGRSAATDLPLEFGQMMRPWLLPAIFAGITSFLNTIGISNPFDWALTYRFFSSMLGWLSAAGLSLCCFVWIPDRKWRNWAVIGTLLIWYLPSLHARHSSENLGGSVFFIGLSLLILCSPAKLKFPERPDHIPDAVALISGALFGFAFEFRYQVGVMILGALLWLICMARVPFRSLLLLGVGILIPIGLGTLADYWGYGQWTCTPWNYLKYNIIENHVSDADTDPWWDYFRRAFTESWPILGFLTLLSFPIAWIRYPKHILTWSMLPLFVVHEIIGHKELRFLFPLAHAGGLLLVLSFNGFPWTRNPFFAWPVRILLAWNIIGLIALSLTPAWMPVRFYQQLYTFHPYRFQLYYKDDSFFNQGGAILNFYRPEDLPLTHIEKYEELVPILDSQEQPIWLFYPRLNLPEEAKMIRDLCQVEFSTLPHWVTEIKALKINERMTNWTLFRCKGLSNIKKNKPKFLDN
jgi:phosphatidylinositol glycan class B